MKRSSNQVVFSNEVESEAEDDPDDVTSVTDDERHAEPVKEKSKQGLMKYFTTAPSPQNNIVTSNNNNSPTFKSHVDKVAEAEFRMILQAVYKNYSNESLNSL